MFSISLLAAEYFQEVSGQEIAVLDKSGRNMMGEK
jgi:hypothetical protein